MKEKNNASALTVLSALYILHNVPAVGYYTPAIAFLLITILLYVFLTFKLSSGGIFRYIALAFPVVCIPFLRLVLTYFSGHHDYFAEGYAFIQVLIYPLLGLYVMKSRNVAFCKTLFLVFLLSYSLTCVTTIIGCNIFPNAARALTGNQDDIALYGQYKRMNIGDFHFVYFITLTLPLVIGSIRFNVIKKSVGIFLVGLVLVTVYFSAYTTALLFCVMAVMLFFVRKNISGRSLLGLIVAGGIAVLVGSALLSTILDSISGSIGNDDVASRVADMSSLFSGETVESLDDSSDVGTRFDLFSRSLRVFAAHPLFGSWSFKGLGGHSFVLDNMGAFGLFGLLCMIWMYSRSFKMFLKPFRSNPWFAFMLSSFALIIFQAFLNPQPTINVLSFILPMYACLMERKTQRKR